MRCLPRPPTSCQSVSDSASRCIPACVPTLVHELKFELGLGFVGVRISTESGEPLGEGLVQGKVDAQNREEELQHSRRVLTDGAVVREERSDELRRLLRVQVGEGRGRKEERGEDEGGEVRSGEEGRRAFEGGEGKEEERDERGTWAP